MTSAPQRTAVILQSSYMPWKGYFDLIAQADVFILYDDVQYTRRDWRNRNRIKTLGGLQWLTIPVAVKGRYHQRICDTRIQDPAWARRHWQRLSQTYARTPGFSLYRERLATLYSTLEKESSLSRVNRACIETVCQILGISTPITWSMDYAVSGNPTERLVALCRQVGATRYLSGPSARDYLEPELFAAAGMELDYADYSAYPAYPQGAGPFEHGVSILDLLFHAGSDAPRYLKHIGP